MLQLCGLGSDVVIMSHWLCQVKDYFRAAFVDAHGVFFPGSRVNVYGRSR